MTTLCSLYPRLQTLGDCPFEKTMHYKALPLLPPSSSSFSSQPQAPHPAQNTQKSLTLVLKNRLTTLTDSTSSTTSHSHLIDSDVECSSFEESHSDSRVGEEEENEEANVSGSLTYGKSVYNPKTRDLIYHGGYLNPDIDETKIRTITIHKSVTKITGGPPGRGGAFEGCTLLSTITIPKTVTQIGEGAFCGCVSLKNVHFSANITKISAYAFFNCYSITSLNISQSCQLIGKSAFAGCSSLKEVKVPDMCRVEEEVWFGTKVQGFSHHKVEDKGLFGLGIGVGMGKGAAAGEGKCGCVLS